jgi:hypothetical protein
MRRKTFCELPDAAAARVLNSRIFLQKASPAFFSSSPFESPLKNPPSRLFIAYLPPRAPF